ncbi:hypothetical protein F4777DRAFT_375547 [Nemania sp. FL0916]|nr:hypothetical protein F4777DRAFT_375547 [Nemania sp. FL0916]
MPAAKIEDVLSTKPVTFKIKTGGGSWQCQIHSNRAAYERVRSNTVSMTAPMPGIVRKDSGLSTMSTASTSSSFSSSSH